MLSIVILVVQSTLIFLSTYYGYMAEIEMDKLANSPKAELLNILSKFNVLHDLETKLDYSVVIIWIITLIRNQVKSNKTKADELALYLPIIISLILGLFGNY